MVRYRTDVAKAVTALLIGAVVYAEQEDGAYWSARALEALIDASLLDADLVKAFTTDAVRAKTAYVLAQQDRP